MRALFEISGLNIYMQIVVTIISITSHLLASRKKKGQRESFIEIIAIYTIGLSGWFSIASGFFGHILYADMVAAGIGWPMDSGFQMELAFAVIGIGLIGFIGFWKKSFWLPYIIARSSILWGAGLTHVLHMIRHNNFSPSNTGIVVIWDFIFPFILIGLFILYHREKLNHGHK